MGLSICYLKNFSVFENIKQSDIDEIAGVKQHKIYKKDDVFYETGQIHDKIYLLNQGEVVLYHMINEKKVVFETLGPGSLFGGIGLAEEAMEHCAQAVSSSQVIEMSQDTVLKIIAKNPQAMIEFIQSVSHRLLSCQDRMKDVALSAEDLLINEISRLSEMRKRRFFGMVDRPLLITHEDLASRTGLNRVTVTKVMKKLRTEGRLLIDQKTGAIRLPK